MNTIELLSLKFFANRFNVPKNKLTYGIITKKNLKSEKVWQMPAILIKGSELFIDICEDRLKHKISDSQYQFEVYHCELIDDGAYYIFRHDEREMKLQKEEIEIFYSDKWLSDASRAIAGATPEDFI